MPNSSGGCPTRHSRTSRRPGSFAVFSPSVTAATSSIPARSTRPSWRSAPSAARAPGSSASLAFTTGTSASSRRRRRTTSGARTRASSFRRRWRPRGRWSGCDFCHWAVLGGIAPPLREGAPPDARTFLVPRRDYTIEDTWHTVGLCGTGSKDLLVDDAFVPDYRTHSYRDAFYLTNPGAVVNDGPLYRLPFGLVFPACIGSPAIGVALGAVAAFREQTTMRISPRDQSRVAEDPFAQLALAEAAAE